MALDATKWQFTASRGVRYIGGSLARALGTPKFVRQQRRNEEALMMCGVM